MCYPPPCPFFRSYFPFFPNLFWPEPKNESSSWLSILHPLVPIPILYVIIGCLYNKYSYQKLFFLQYGAIQTGEYVKKPSDFQPTQNHFVLKVFSTFEPHNFQIIHCKHQCCGAGPILTSTGSGYRLRFQLPALAPGSG